MTSSTVPTGSAGPTDSAGSTDSGGHSAPPGRPPAAGEQALPGREPAPVGGTPPDDGFPTRVAVVGAGFIADFHLEILRDTPGVEVVCVCDADLERARSAARRFGVAEATADVSDLALLGVQVAHLLVPPALHERLALELLEAGVGVFVEKPLALSGESARRVARRADELGLPLGVNHNALFHPAFAELARRVDAGEIGRLEHVQITLQVPLRQLDAGDFSHWMFREPRNIVYEQAPHPLAQLHALVGRALDVETRLLGSRELHPGQVFHERWSVAARAEHATAEIHLGFGRSFTRSTLTAIGSDGFLEADLSHGLLRGERKTPWLDFWNSFLAGWRGGGSLRRWSLRGLRQYLMQTLGLARRQDAFFASMRGSIQAFHRALHEGRCPPAGGPQAAEVLDWCDAVARAAAPAAADSAAGGLPEPGEPRTGEVVVLGGTGFIGRATVARLLAAGRPVTCMVRRTHGLPPEIVSAARGGELRLVPGRLEDAESLGRALRGARCVVHLATGGGASWDDVERGMVRGTRRVGEACLEHGVERLVFVSSTAALYLGPDAGDEVGDEVPPDPRPGVRPVYARGKIFAERELTELARTRGLRTTILRPGVVLGAGTPMQHSGLGLWVRDNHCVGWGRGRHPLPLVLVDDVADAIALLVEHEGDDLDGRALNLCASPPLSARDVVAELRRATGRDLSFHPRSLAVSQMMEIGKWLVKVVGRRPGVEFPSWRDLKSRSLSPRLPCSTARDVLGWRPVEEREAFLDRAVRVHGAGPAGDPGSPGSRP